MPTEETILLMNRLAYLWYSRPCQSIYLFPEWSSCGQGVQLQLVTLQVEQSQVQTLDLDQHLRTKKLKGAESQMP